MDGDYVFERRLTAPTPQKGRAPASVLLAPHWKSTALLPTEGEKHPTGPQEQAHGKRDWLHAPLRRIRPQDQDLTRDVSLNSPETREQGELPDIPTSSPHHRCHRGTVYK